MAREQWIRSWCTVGLLALVLVAPAAAQPVTVGPRDHVTVAVFGVERLTGKFSVNADGTLNFPLLGPVAVAGLTTREVELELGKRLVDGGFFTVMPQITVELEQTPNKRVTVTGAVRSAGLINYAGELTLLEALVRAGGAASDAGEEVLVVRATPSGNGSGAPASELDEADDNDVISVNLSELAGGNIAAHNLVLQDGDMIIVQKALSVYVSGFVRGPGAYRVESGTTVLQVLSLAGGLTERGTTRGLRILRDSKEIRNVKLDTVVRPGDTVIVRSSPW